MKRENDPGKLTVLHQAKDSLEADRDILLKEAAQIKSAKAGQKSLEAPSTASKAENGPSGNEASKRAFDAPKRSEIPLFQLESNLAVKKAELAKSSEMARVPNGKVSERLLANEARLEKDIAALEKQVAEQKPKVSPESGTAPKGTERPNPKDGQPQAKAKSKPEAPAGNKDSLKPIDVSDIASEDGFKLAYRRAAMYFHPDRNRLPDGSPNPDAGAIFRELKDAFESRHAYPLSSRERFAKVAKDPEAFLREKNEAAKVKPTEAPKSEPHMESRSNANAKGTESPKPKDSQPQAESQAKPEAPSGNKEPLKPIDIGDIASEAGFKKAYRKAAMYFHPDRNRLPDGSPNPDAEAIFKELKDAHESGDR